MRALTFYETPLLTAYSNDHGYECAFERLVKLWANKEDMLIAISSSGKSENILRAVQVSLERECWIVTLSGFQHDNLAITSCPLIGLMARSEFSLAAFRERGAQASGVFEHQTICIL